MLHPVLRGARHPVAFFANGIGDGLLTVPVVRALAELFPGRLTVLGPRKVLQLCYRFLPLRECIELAWDPEAGDANGAVEPNRFKVADAAARVPACDLFLSLVPWHAESLEELVLRLLPRTTVGLRYGYDLVAEDRPDAHYADRVFEVVKRCAPGLRPEDFAQPPPLAKPALDKAQKLRGHLPEDSRVLAVHPDTLSIERQWEPARFAAVLDAFLERHPRYFALIIGSAYEDLERGPHADRIISCFGLPLDISVALVSAADLFLGVNSSMVHAADLYRVPGVGLFGPEKGMYGSRIWGLRFGPGRHVAARESMSDITVTAVLEALEDLASREDPGHA